MKKIFAFSLVLLFIGFSVRAQLDLGSLLEGGVEDGNKLLEKYLEPAFAGLGYGLNSGWYNTGKPHKLLGFDITVTPSLAYVQGKNQFFTINPDDYTNVTTISGDPEQAPTIMGPNLDADEIPYLGFNIENDNPDDDIWITSPTGLGLKEELGMNAVPAASVQLGLGLIKNTELKLRLLPKQTFGDPGEEFSTQMFGIGFMHDVKQWIPGVKNLPFDLSGFIGFNNFKNSYQLDADNPDQVAELNVFGTTLQGVISKKFSILTAYAGLGIITSKTTFSMKGDYDIDSSETTLTDPISLEYKNGGPRANIGARLKLLILTLHAEYALQKYNTLSVGVGLSIR